MSIKSQDISTDLFTSNLAVGSSTGGYDYGFVGDLGHRVKEITITLCDEQMNIGRICIVKYDQTSTTVGGNNGLQPERVLTWRFEPDEQLTRIRLYSKNNRLAGIKLSTSKQTDLEACVTGVSETSPTPVEIPVGSGKWMGIFGFSGRFVDSLGFAMLKN